MLGTGLINSELEDMEERGGVVKAKLDSDITFLIGVEPFTEIIPAKAAPLAERSPVFRAMLEGPLAEDRGRLINIQDVDPRAFEILISFMTGDAVRFQSVPTALNVIYAAKKYMVRKIDDLALKFIYKNINSHNVLLVLQNVLMLQEEPEVLPSAPSLALLDQEENLCSSQEEQEAGLPCQVDEAQLSRAPCEKVVKHCFTVLDRNAKQVLESDEFEDISLELMKTIIRRDTLALSSELIVWHAVARWSHRACRRRHLVPTPENKRVTLEGGQYLIRFLTMTAEEFKAGQAATKLLTEEEEINILFSLLHIGAVLPKDLQEYKRVMQTLRRGRRGWRSGVWIRRRQKAERKENENVCSNARKKLGFIEEIFVLFACLFD